MAVPLPGKGVCGGRNVWLRLTTASAQCFRLSERFFHFPNQLSGKKKISGNARVQQTSAEAADPAKFLFLCRSGKHSVKTFLNVDRDQRASNKIKGLVTSETSRP